MMRRIVLLLMALLFVPAVAIAQQVEQADQTEQPEKVDQAGQEDNDSIVRLITASRAQLMEIDGKAFRRVEGDAVFFHNNTYLYCDTAFWSVQDNYIDAIGHVQIVQDNTILTSDKLHYDIEGDLASFRGTLVQLEDRDSNILRTNNLDYNTRDSVAFFTRGASMRDKDGNIIESVDGTFDSKINLFTFTREVEMFSDSMFFTCERLTYDTKLDKATFENNTKGFSNRNHIRSEKGWYDKKTENIFFEGDVYVQTEEYEAWSQKLLYDKMSNNVKMYDNAEVLDTVHNVMAAGGYLEYNHSPRKVLLTENPSLIGMMKDKNDTLAPVDTLFLRADTLIYECLRKYQVPGEVANAEERLKNLNVDVVANKKANAASEAAAAKAAQEKNNPNKKPPGSRIGIPGKSGTVSADAAIPALDAAAPPDTTISSDTISVEPLDSAQLEIRMAELCDSLSSTDSLFVFDEEFAPDSVMIAAMDSVTKNWKDTTIVPFLHGFHNVRMFKSNMQMVCDSMEYSDLDSIARLYIDPFLWKDITTQLTSDSMQFVIKNGTIERGIMLSNALIVAEHEKNKYYNQIKAPEMVGYFEDDGNSLKRFDASGGVQALFFLEEDSVVTTMNHKQTKVMSATFKNGEIRRVIYMEDVKSDAYPVWDLWKKDKEKMKLKGYVWAPEKRPVDRYSVTSQTIKPSERNPVREEKQFPIFKFTDVYFKGYMDGIINEINEREPVIWLPEEKNNNEYGTTIDRKDSDSDWRSPRDRQVDSDASGL